MAVTRSSSRSRTEGSKLRMVSVRSTLSGITFDASPPWMAPTLTTAASRGSTLRDTTL